MTSLWDWLAYPQAAALAEWFAAIGTVGAFAFAIVLFLQDRARRERAQADRLVAFVTPVQDELGTYEFTIHNTSDQPIFRLMPRIYDKAANGAQVQFEPPHSRGAASTEVWRLDPGASRTARFKLPENWESGMTVKLDFFDATSRYWTKDVVTQKYDRRRYAPKRGDQLAYG